jgi:multidrug efflux system outer membrane protein
MLKQRAARFLWFLAIIPAIFSAETLTLDKAIETALANNGDLQKNVVALQQAARNQKSGWNQFLPQISTPSVGVTNTHQISPVETASGSGNSSSAANTSLWAWNSISLGASLSFTADIPTQFKLLDSKYRKAAEDYENVRRSLVATVSTGFYSLLGENLNIEILKTDLELKQAQYEQIRMNYERGLASELDMLNAQYAYHTAGPALNNAVSGYEEKLADFLLLIGMDAKSGVALEGVIEIASLALPPAKELAARFLDNRNDVKTQVNALEQARLNASSRINQALPSINFSETISISPKTNTNFAFEDPTTSGRFSLSLSIPIAPWIPGSSQDLARKDGKDAVAQGELSLETTKKTAALDIQKKVDEIERIAENMESQELNHRITRRAYELSEQGYRSGLVSQTDLQSANQRMVSAQQAVVTAQISYLTAVYNLASALGLDIPEVYRLYAKKE